LPSLVLKVTITLSLPFTVDSKFVIKLSWFKTIFLVYFDQFKKIYTFPYDDTKITNFILKYSSYLKKVKKNPLFKFKGNLIQRTDDSLCFMLLSDL
jgi:hypothetical protein